MRRVKIDVGAFPSGISGCRVFYKSQSVAGWVKLADSTVPTFEVEIQEDLPVSLRAHALDSRGTMLTAYREATINAAQVVADRTDPKDETPPTPKFTQDTGTMTLTSVTWSNTDPKEYEAEVRVAGTSVATKDAPTSGYVEANDPIAIDIPPDQSSVKVHTRLRRKVDGALSGWQSSTVSVADPEVAGIDDHDTEFASGTLGTVDGQTNAEIIGGDLQHKAIYAGDAGIYAGDATTVYAGSATLYWGPLQYTTANLVPGDNQPLSLQISPELTGLTRTTVYAGDAHWYAGGSPIEQSDGTPYDGRVWDDNLLNGADETPPLIEYKVATSASASPTFTDSDFVTHYPGRVYPDVHTYAVRVIVHCWIDLRVIIDKLLVRRWIFCKTRPWCTHSSASVLLFHTTLTSNQASVDWVVDGEDWDALLVEVDWESKYTGGSTFEVHFNGSSANSVQPSGTLVQLDDNEHLRFQILPKTGRRRRTVLEYAYDYDGITGTTGSTATVGTVDEWNDTSTAITSIRFSTDDDPNTALGSGTTIRAWGLKFHDGA